MIGHGGPAIPEKEEIRMLTTIAAVALGVAAFRVLDRGVRANSSDRR